VLACTICLREQTTTTTASVKNVCVDHDSRCPRFKDQICQPTVPDEYVIATCALTCDKCPEYLGICKYGIRLIIVNKIHDNIFS
jgi:hypothetical protein